MCIWLFTFSMYKKNVKPHFLKKGKWRCKYRKWLITRAYETVCGLMWRQRLQTKHQHEKSQEWKCVSVCFVLTKLSLSLMCFVLIYWQRALSFKGNLCGFGYHHKDGSFTWQRVCFFTSDWIFFFFFCNLQGFIKTTIFLHVKSSWKFSLSLVQMVIIFACTSLRLYQSCRGQNVDARC